MLSISTKSQLWSIDFLLGTFIFILSIVFLYTYIINTPQQDTGELTAESEIISTSLLSEGYPTNWTPSNVIKIGLISNRRLNETKLDYFSQLSYEESKSKLNVMDDYFIYFLDNNTQVYTIGSINGIGKPGINSTNLKEIENPSKIIRTDRIIVYNNNILRMVLYTWA